MKKIGILILTLTIFSCSSKQNVGNNKKPLFVVLTEKSQGGAKIRFSEIISEPQEFLMIQNDPELKRKVFTSDIATANFVLLSMGEKPTGGYSIGVANVEETDKNIIVTVKETAPEPGSIVTQAFTYPYCLLKINSKKEIIIQ